ncbi:MAG TPA: rhomboid family intramembrane serine protease [Candidatus Acidoferrum sp.]|nr:rhomboid family intramembrane serine protease [Candidatus Acidoferrum sp.]
MLEDRSYMRENPHRSRWSANAVVMVAIVVCFALQNIATFYLRYPVGEYLALSKQGVQNGFVWQLLTFQFLHAGLGHIFGNLLGLFFFGRSLEARLGTKEYLKVYFLSGFAGGLLQLALMWIWPEFYGQFVVGASAGVLGIIAAFAIMDPEGTVMLNFLIPLKLKYLLYIELGISLFFTVVPAGNVAHAAHLGGILMAMGYIRWSMHRPSVEWNPLKARQRKRELVQAASKAVRWRQRSAATPELPSEEFISREVDPILDKISAHGIHSLTPREREILEAARAKISKR